MSARFSEALRRRLGDERGSVIVLVAVGMAVLLLGSAFAVEFGRTYLEILRLSRAVDAGALAAARVMRLGEGEAEDRAFAVAAANGIVDGRDGVGLELDFTPNAAGQMTVVMTATRDLPLPLGRIMGREELSISSEAAAASPPVDLMMVIDQSNSLAIANAWDELQDAATTFLGFFGAGYDQLGLVSYHTRGVERGHLRSDFAEPVKNSIEAMTSFGSTNMEDGLRLARKELDGPRTQPGSLKAVVFFTDGWANSFRTMLPIPYLGNLEVVLTSGFGATRAYYYPALPENRDGLSLPCGSLCAEWPSRIVEEEARERALELAEELRDDGVYIYTIGLNDVATDEEPDMELLREMANENGAVDPRQPQGRAYYAPSPDDLEEMFTRVASDLMVHLVR